MRTKIRLALDASIQLLLILLLLLQITSSPAETLQHLGIFAFVISIWQIGHAIYVVEKHQDWYRGIYLNVIKRVILLSIFIVIIASLVALLSLGSLLPYVLQGLQLFGLGLGVVVAILAFQYFGRSLINLYAYYTHPRSFWDL